MYFTKHHTKNYYTVEISLYSVWSCAIKSFISLVFIVQFQKPRNKLNGQLCNTNNRQCLNVTTKAHTFWYNLFYSCDDNLFYVLKLK